jgi:hypothetical protein
MTLGAMGGREQATVRGLELAAVVTHHRNPYRSGVARFNHELAARLGVPLLGLDDWSPAAGPALLSFKVSELSPGEAERLAAQVDAAPEGAISFFLHDFCDSPLERRLLTVSQRVLCGNDEILAAVRGVAPAAEVLWAPGLILDANRFEPAAVSVFSFGMAHKIRTDMFRRLRGLLEVSGSSYALYFSNANHETASEHDTESLHGELRGIFPRVLYFMGNLSDVAVYNQLVTTTFFAAFFRNGARANNTSIASAMEHGAVVITNLDEHSPPDFVHGHNVLDIERLETLPSDPLELRRLSVHAIETARSRGWSQLVDRIRDGG